MGVDILECQTTKDSLECSSPDGLSMFIEGPAGVQQSNRSLSKSSLEKKYLKDSMEHRNTVSPNMFLGWSTNYIEYVWSMAL